jgi:hypothetical protein
VIPFVGFEIKLSEGTQIVAVVRNLFSIVAIENYGCDQSITQPEPLRA